jgi:2'-5' RNA ligase
VIEKKFTDFVWCKVEMASIYDLAIPKHRIEYFKYHTEIVWSKKDRIDKIFGSSNSSDETIFDLIERIEAAIVQDEQDHDGTNSELESKSKGAPFSKSNKPYGQGLRPTHFICLPFQDPQIRENVSTVQKTICIQSQYQGNDADRVRDEACIPLTALHMTLVMMRLPTPESVEVARREFSRMQDLLQVNLPRHLLLTLQGVGDFGGRVVYTEPVEVGRVSALVADMKLRLTRAGIHLVGNHDPFQPHVTVAKLNRGLSRDWNGASQMDHSVYGRHQHMWVGSQACLSLELCELYSEKHPVTGFYKCIETLSNTVRFAPLRGIVQCTSRGRGKVMSTEDPLRITEQCLGVSVEALQAQPSEQGCYMIVMRGLPGSGKSTLAAQIAAEWDQAFQGCCEDARESCSLSVSADTFMFGEGRKFDPGALAGAHARCLQQARDFLKRFTESSPIAPPHPGLLIIDNTNTTISEYAEYVKMGREHGVSVGVVEVESSVASAEPAGICHMSLERAVAVAKGGLHNVPEEAVRKMWKR